MDRLADLEEWSRSLQAQSIQRVQQRQGRLRKERGQQQAGVRERTHEVRWAWGGLDGMERRAELDLNLPPPLVTVGRWLLRAEAVLADEEEHTP